MLAKLAREARSYAERIFAYPKIGRLDELSARQALEVPARKEGAEFTDNAMAEILKVTERYFFFRCGEILSGEAPSHLHSPLRTLKK